MPLRPRILVPCVLFILSGCDSTTEESVKAACAGAGVADYDEPYCDCALTNLSPSKEMLHFYLEIGELKSQIARPNERVSHGALAATIQSSRSSIESACKEEGTSDQNTLTSLVPNRICITGDENGNTWQTDDPEICGETTPAADTTNPPTLYPAGCSYLDAPSSQAFLTLTAKVENASQESQSVLRPQASNPKMMGNSSECASLEAPDKVAACMQNTLTSLQANVMAGVRQSQATTANALALQPNPYATDQSSFDLLNETSLELVRSTGDFGFGKVVEIHSDGLTTTTVSKIINHQREDFFSATQRLEPQGNILSQVSFLVSSLEGYHRFWVSDSGVPVNLDGAKISSTTLALLFPEAFKALQDLMGPDIVRTLESCISTKPSKAVEGKDALDLL
jgi:hypothetical protein